MSLDISLKEKPEISFNYTHNVTPIWKEIGVYDALYNSHDKRVVDVISDLRKGVLDGPCKIKYLRMLNPKNGWGDADSALDWLWQVYRTFVEYEDCTIEVCK